MRRRTFVLLMPALLLARRALAAPPAATGAPGRVARVSLGGAGDPAPQAYLDGRRLMVRREQDEWIALAGIPLSAKPRSTLPVEIDYGGGKREVRKLPIAPWKYRTQHLSVPADQAELPAVEIGLRGRAGGAAQAHARHAARRGRGRRRRGERGPRKEERRHQHEERAAPHRGR